MKTLEIQGRRQLEDSASLAPFRFTEDESNIGTPHDRHDGSISCLSRPSIGGPAPWTWDPIRVAHYPGSLSPVVISVY
ncbi:hypothetical protein CTA1_747 [Colletotrichum tanaceti]|uniref:Uncharacterized protein n=1 Tax=Colletotrichum tanaceti TaxID=1306861 RepID=A0A4U6XQE6_9PEZI|nr:hypothetical protein CTA1_747 [Colletotrichum tanaceti]